MTAPAVPAVALSVLADQISAEHDAATRAIGAALEHAHQAGALLLEAKGRLEHGAWLSWLAEACPTLPARTAQLYMRIASRWPELESKCATGVAYLPLREAAALLSEPRPLIEIGPAGEEDLDLLARAETNAAAWEELKAALDSLAARVTEAATIEEAAQNYHLAIELEGRAVALRAATDRNVLALNRFLARLEAEASR